MRGILVISLEEVTLIKMSIKLSEINVLKNKYILRKIQVKMHKGKKRNENLKF